MSHTRLLTAALSLATLALISASCSDDDSAGTPSGSTSEPAISSSTTSAATPTTDVTTTSGPATSVEQLATVTVAIERLAGHEGQHLAGILYAGSDFRSPRGGFAAEVDADPYSSAQQVRIGYDDFPPPGPVCTDTPRPPDCIPFPYVTDQTLTVAPGTYQLQLWLSPAEMGPYARWVPGEQEGLAGCATTVEVRAPATTVTVTAIPGTLHRQDPCILADPSVPDPVTYAGQATYVTGTIEDFTIDQGTVTDDGNGASHSRGGTLSYTMTANDPRAAGTLTATWNSDRWGVEGDGALVQWGEAVLTNDSGTWEGPYTGALASDHGGDVVTRWLVGTGAFEGLTFYWWIPGYDGAIDGAQWYGLIYPGEPPPDAA